MNGRITREAKSREFVCEPSFVRTATLCFQQHNKKEREKIERATLPSVPFVGDEVTSQQVLECWKCSTRELCRTSVSPRRICDRSIFAKIVYERGG